MPTFNNNWEADEINAAQAENIDTVNFSSTSLPKEEKDFFQKIGEVLPPPVREEYTPRVMGFAALPPEMMEEPETKGKWQALLDMIAPYSQKTGKVIAAFGQAALETLQIRNPWVAGTIAAIREAREKAGGGYYSPGPAPSGPLYPSKTPFSPDDNNQPPPGY